jgi:hypothetical protein
MAITEFDFSLTHEEKIDILLEVSALLNEPEMFYQGRLSNNDRTRHCTFGHLNVVFAKKYNYSNEATYRPERSEMATKLNEKAQVMYPDCPLGQSGGAVWEFVCIPSVNDNLGRIEAKSVVDAVIQDMKDGLY